MKQPYFEYETSSISSIQGLPKIMLYYMSPSTTWQDIGIDLVPILREIIITYKVVDNVLFKALMAKVGVLKYDKCILICCSVIVDTTLIA